MLRNKVLPRFFKTKRNNLVFFRKLLIVAALNHGEIALFLPTFSFTRSQRLTLRRDLLSLLPEARFLAGAPAFNAFLPLNFCSTNNHFIISLPRASAFVTAANFLLEKHKGAWPSFVFVGGTSLNLQNTQGFLSLYHIFSNEIDCWPVFRDNLFGGVLHLNYLLANYLSYVCFFIINYLQAVLILLVQCCLYFNCQWQ